MAYKAKVTEIEGIPERGNGCTTIQIEPGYTLGHDGNSPWLTGPSGKDIQLTGDNYSEIPAEAAEAMGLAADERDADELITEIENEHFRSLGYTEQAIEDYWSLEGIEAKGGKLYITDDQGDRSETEAPKRDDAPAPAPAVAPSRPAVAQAQPHHLRAALMDEALEVMERLDDGSCECDINNHGVVVRCNHCRAKAWVEGYDALAKLEGR